MIVYEFQHHERVEEVSTKVVVPKRRMKSENLSTNTLHKERERERGKTEETS